MTEHYHGHRARLLERFNSAGLAGMHDYEVVELLLTFIIPRVDTKPIAKRLLKRYKTVSGILNAPYPELITIEGFGPKSASFVTFFRDIIPYCLYEKYRGKSIVSHRKDVEAYLRFKFSMKRNEYLAALYLDNGNHILNTEIIFEGTVNQCAIYPRKIIEKALLHSASSIILAHNHPGGCMQPSEADWNITERIHQLTRLLDMSLLDHIIISHNRAVSLRDLQRWPK